MTELEYSLYYYCIITVIIEMKGNPLYNVTFNNNNVDQNNNNVTDPSLQTVVTYTIAISSNE